MSETTRREETYAVIGQGFDGAFDEHESIADALQWAKWRAETGHFRMPIERIERRTLIVEVLPAAEVSK